MRVVQHDGIVLVLLKVFGEENLCRADLLSCKEAIKMSIVILVTQLNLSVDPKGLSDDDFDVRVELRDD